MASWCQGKSRDVSDGEDRGSIAPVTQRDSEAARKAHRRRAPSDPSNALAPARAANQTGSGIMTTKQDRADHEKDIHWPKGFDPSQTDLFSHNALLINASRERTWGHIVDATKWPSFEIRKL
jgi:hypothetical protein